MIKVLHYIPGFHTGGIESLFLSWYRFIDKEKVTFELLMRIPDTSDSLRWYEELGGAYHRLEKMDKKRMWRFKKSVRSFFESHHDYDILHCHVADPYIMHYAKYYGIRRIIFHAHTTREDLGYRGLAYRMVRKYQISRYVTDAFAVSDGAAKWGFEKSKFGDGSIVIIKNGIDTEKYRFDPQTRNLVRKNMGWQNRYVVGFVGRLTPPKNPIFLSEIMIDLSNEHGVSCVIIGDGPAFEYMKSVCGDSVSFLGLRDDVSELMQGMDCLLLPSIWEGFPVVLTEAQCCGLPAIISEVITKEVDITDLITRMSLSDDKKNWSKIILMQYKRQRIDKSMQVKQAGFEQKDVVEDLLNRYMEMAS